MTNRNPSREGPLPMSVTATTDPHPPADACPTNGGKHDMRRKIQAVCGELLETLLKKNRDYGNQVARKPVLAPKCDSELAIKVRMSDKIDRLVNLFEIGDPQVEESIDETMLDLAGYAVLFVALRRTA